MEPHAPFGRIDAVIEPLSMMLFKDAAENKQKYRNLHYLLTRQNEDGIHSVDGWR